MTKDKLIIYWMEKCAKQAEEIDRLRSVIEVESAKWKDHHDDQQWKDYWAAFGKKIHP